MPHSPIRLAKAGTEHEEQSRHATGVRPAPVAAPTRDPAGGADRPGPEKPGRMPDELLVAKEAARRLGVTVSTLYSWLGQSARGLLVIRGVSVTIEYLQGGPRAGRRSSWSRGRAAKGAHAGDTRSCPTPPPVDATRPVPGDYGPARSARLITMAP